MNKEFIPYEQALELKKLGFEEPCFGLYAPPSKTVFLRHYGLLSAKEQILAPLYQQAFRWFREKHNLHCNIDLWGYCIFDDNGTEKTGFETYEQSQLECLEKLIEIVKKQK
jgi:hypothetical protein